MPEFLRFPDLKFGTRFLVRQTCMHDDDLIHRQYNDHYAGVSGSRVYQRGR